MRRGSFAAYLPIEHPDVKEFLRIRSEGNAIQEMYNKDPEGFIRQFAEKKEAHFKTLDDYGKFGDGWINRLKELESEALASI